MQQGTLDQALAHHQAGRLDLAEAGYRALLAAQPHHADALHLLGGIAMQRQTYDLAADWISQAIAANPKIALYHANLAAVELARGRHQAALAACEQALARDQNCAEAHNHRGTALVYLQRYDEAKIAYQRALDLAPDYAEARANLGNVARAQGDWAAAKQHYRDALARNPNSAEACNNLAALLLAEKQTEEAAHWLEKALALDDSLTEAHENLAFVYLLQGRDHEAGLHFQTAAARFPDHALKQLRTLLVFPMIPASTKAIGYQRKRFQKNLAQTAPICLDTYRGALAKSNVHPPFQLAYHGENNRALKQQYAALFEPGTLAWRDPSPPDGPNIGMLVTRGHEGIFLACCKGLILNWDTQKAPLTLIAPAASIHILQSHLKRDDLRWCAISENLVEALHQVRAERFALVYFWEVGSDSLNYFLALLRVARRQCTSWGSPETTGVAAVDAYLTATPWHDTDVDHYSEKLLQLPLIPCCYTPPADAAVEQVTRADLDCAPEKPMIFCPQNLFKFHPDFDHILRQILEKDRDVFIAIVEGKRKHWTTLLLKRLERVLGNNLNRIRVLPRLNYAAYLAMVQQCDLLLDSLYFSGGNTSFEGLALGTPIVTLPGTFLRGRFTFGCYQQMGDKNLLAACVAQTADDWVEKAVRLATDRDQQNQVRESLRQSRQHLFARVDAAECFQQTLMSLCES